MKRTTSIKCHFEGCKEYGHFCYDSGKEAKEGYEYRNRWYCGRHTNMEKILSIESPIRTTVFTVVESGNHSYWSAEGELKSGFTSGNGYKAYSKDFPIGTKLTVEAHIELP